VEKLVYALWDTDAEKLCQQLPGSIDRNGGSVLRINVQDDRIADGSGLIQSRSEPLPNAVVQLWLPSSNIIFRKEVDSVINEHCSKFHAWLVAESTIIPNEKHPAETGQRTNGFAQMAFLTLPSKMDWKDWRAVWRDYHTQVAIDTQSNFEYIQNLVIEPLTEDASPYVAIVEECFPIEALTDPFVFFDAVGDQQKFEKNLGIMMDSCGRFIAPGTIDVFPTSQFNY
jgi:EthD domain